MLEKWFSIIYLVAVLCFPDTAECQIDVGNIFFFEDSFYFIDKQICQVPEKVLIEHQEEVIWHDLCIKIQDIYFLTFSWGYI